MNNNSIESQPSHSQYDEIVLPASTPSAIVAVSTLVGVLILGSLLIALVHFRHQVWRTCWSWWRHYTPDQVGLAKRAREEEAEERLREDSVVIHDVGFPEEAYYRQDHVDGQRPQPSPSMFKDGAFFDELMTSYEEICSPSSRASQNQDNIVHFAYVKEILEDVVKKVTNAWGTVDLGNTDKPMMKRNSSYQEALANGLDFPLSNEIFFTDSSREFSPSNPFAMKSCSSDDLNPFANHSQSKADSLHDIQPSTLEKESFSLNSFDNQEKIKDDHNVCLEIDEAMLQAPITKQSFPSNCKWQSTPILGLDHDEGEQNLQAASSDEADNSLFNALKVSRSYSPVYKMSFNSSFGSMTRHNYFVNDD